MTAALLEKFRILVSEDSPSPQALAVLSDLKIATLQLKHVFSGSRSAEANSERKIVLAMLENAILLATKIGDWHDETSLFANAYAQLRSIYIDHVDIVDINFKNEIFGLNLFRLLINNKLMEFHMELELLTPQERGSDPISFVIGLEQALAEGSYHKVLSAERRIPVDSFRHFLPFLKDAVRADVANCSEKAYDSLSLDDAQNMLFFDNQQELKNFVSQREEWNILNDRVVFQARETSQVEIPGMRLVSQSLSYANELERIV